MPLADRFRFLMSLSNSAAADQDVTRTYHRQLNELVAYVEAGKRAGEISKSLPTVWVVASYDAMLNAAWSLIQRGKMSSEKATEVFTESFVASVSASRC